MSLTSEFTCEVIKVTQILPHPNADRLEIIKFATKEGGETAYSVVHGKDQLKVGDLAVYVSVDSMVPVEGIGSERWAFCKTRLDYRKGSERYRIKAARLRGVYSEGILSPLGDGYALEFGDDDIPALWNIVKYERPEPTGPTQPGESTGPDPVNRARKRITNKMFPEYGILSYRKSPYALKEGNVVAFTEKIHGCNMRCGYLPVQGIFRKPVFVVGSHRAIKTDIRTWYEKLWDRVTGVTKSFNHWYKEDVWNATATRLNLKDKMARYPNLVIYGEVFGLTPSGARIQDLTYGDRQCQFRLIDAYDRTTDTFLTLKELQHLASELGVETVPVLHIQLWGEDAREFMVREAEVMSTIDATTIMEGFVIRDINDSTRVKYVSQQYFMRKDSDNDAK